MKQDEPRRSVGEADLTINKGSCLEWGPVELGTIGPPFRSSDRRLWLLTLALQLISKFQKI